MNKKDIVIGVVVLVVVIGTLYWIKRNKTLQVISTPIPSVEKKLESSFNFTIPEDVDKAELKDVSGGTGSGIATRKFVPTERGKTAQFSHMVLADLPDPLAGTFYEGWLVRGKEGDPNFDYLFTGKMRIAKGGYLLEFNSTKDYSDYKGVVVTLEKVDDKKPEKHILEGSF